MAQVLKEEVRLCILQAANDEILKFGEKGIQMRKIAEGANMTVGNLYRYYQDKEHLIDAILEPALKDLDTLIRKISNQKISLLQKSSPFDLSQIYENFEVCANGLTEIFHNHKGAMILISTTRQLDDLSNWFKSVVQTGLVMKEPDMSSNDIELLSELIAISVIKGMQECFLMGLKYPEKMKNLDQIIYKYLQIVLWK